MDPKYRRMCLARTLGALATLGIYIGCSAGESGQRPAGKTDSLASNLSTVSVTQGGDELRTSWYSDEAGLTPSVVSSSNFGQLFSTAVNGQVYAQPLVSQGTLFVATENNFVYGLDPQTGAINWSRSLGSAAASSDIGCGDLTPFMGITGTPVIDR